MTEVKANMAGNVWKIVVEEGETVTEGQDIADTGIYENGNTIYRYGKMKEFKVSEGDFINEGDVIAIIE